MPISEDPPPVDRMLQMFVEIMNKAGAQMGFTVLVGGTWVSGTLIPPRMFMEECGAHAVAQAGEDAAGIRTFFHEVGRMAFPSESEADAGVATEPPAAAGPYYLHLRNARSVSHAGPRLPTEGGAYLRVRLSEIAAWFIGELGPPGYVQ